MKTIADLKRRVTVGTRLTLDKFTVAGLDRPHKYLNVGRKVVKAQTNSFACATEDSEPSWCDWPKAAEFAPDEDGNGFGVTHGNIYLHYRIEE